MTTTDPKIATREEWLRARTELLAAEKAATRHRDELARQRRALPWVRVEEGYEFDTVDGPRSLAQLFGDQSQLLVYHFMFGPDWEEGCPSCSFWADNFDGIGIHLAHRDVALVAVSRAPLDRIGSYRERMGWSFPWVSSGRSRFNLDFGVSDATVYNYVDVAQPADEMPGLSAFALVDGDVFHTYSCYGRGIDVFNGAYQLLDLAPRGRDEDQLPHTMAWLHRHDAYDS